MKNKINKIIFLLATATYTFSCNSRDPLSRNYIGDIATDEFYKKIQVDGLVEKSISSDEDYDTLYTYYINGDTTLRSILWTNKDDYDFDSLYSIKLNIGSDSTLFFGRMTYRPGKGEVKKEKLNSILALYKKWYGEPNYEFEYSEDIEKIFELDSLFLLKKNQDKEPESLDKSVSLNKTKSTLKEQLKNAKIIYPNGKTHYTVWKLEKFNILISFNFDEKDTIYKNAYIKYEITNYKEKIENKKEYIRQNATLNDYIKIDINLDPFTENQYTNRLNLTISSIFHNLPEEPRNIRNFKFDVIIQNEYLDTLLVVEDLEYDGIGILESAYYRGVASSPGGLLRYYVDYSPFSNSGKQYEELRRLRERKIENRNFDDIKVSYNIKSIVFENGDVIK